MLDIYFYNSYNLSPVGYQMTKIDHGVLNVVPINQKNSQEVPAEVINYLTHGGAKMLFSKIQGDKFLFVIKGIICEDKTKSNDEMGRKWFINMAIVSDKIELEALCPIVTLVLTDFEAFKMKISELVKVSSEELSYSVDYDKLYHMIGYYRRTFVGYHIHFAPESIISRPFDMAGEKYFKLLRDVIEYRVDEEIFLVVLEGSLDYFYSSCRLPRGVKPKYSFSPVEEGKEKIYENDHKELHRHHDIENQTVKTALLVGTGILCAGVCIGLIVGRHKDK